MPVRKTTVSIPPEIAQAMDNRNDQFSTAISRSLARYISLLQDVDMVIKHGQQVK